MQTTAEILFSAVAVYPIATAALWVAGGLMFSWIDRRGAAQQPAEGELPGVTVLIPAYNEAAVIATSVRAALEADYPKLELIVLDDGSVDGTESAARAAARGDPRCSVIRDPVNRGKAHQLNRGFELATHELVAVTDADTHMLPHALRRMVPHMLQRPLVAAVAAEPHVTNRTRLITGMQVLESAAIIGLIRRSQAVGGRVGTVAGVLGLFRRDRVLAVGGYDGQMATEDIELTWKLLLAGWYTTYEPRALVGMEVPESLGALWAQRKRWARGQGEVLHRYAGQIILWRNRHMWRLAIEAVASLAFIVVLGLSFVLSLLSGVFGEGDFMQLGIAWGIAISVVATLQVTVALALRHRYDPAQFRALLLGPLYPLLYWLLAGCAALRSEVPAFVRGPREERVVWDIPRTPLDSTTRP
jgi:poly-beta-1,6-N-acetyl-D-glucosamine synthase